jgi:MinD superfamily P-loop ATPase
MNNKRIVRFIEIEDGEIRNIIDQWLYSLFRKPMTITNMYGKVIASIEKQDIPICDLCNSPAEYAVIINDDGEEFLTECICERCRNNKEV